MQTQTNDANLSLPGVKERGSRGRKDKEGVEAIIKAQPIKDASADTMKLLRKAEAAKTLFNEALKAMAERSNTSVSTLKKLFKASLKGNFAEVQHKIEQEQEVFQTIGEIGGGKSNGGE